MSLSWSLYYFLFSFTILFPNKGILYLLLIINYWLYYIFEYHIVTNIYIEYRWKVTSIQNCLPKLSVFFACNNIALNRLNSRIFILYLVNNSDFFLILWQLNKINVTTIINGKLSLDLTIIFLDTFDRGYW